jgi:hypothetical protein
MTDKDKAGNLLDQALLNSLPSTENVPQTFFLFSE